MFKKQYKTVTIYKNLRNAGDKSKNVAISLKVSPIVQSKSGLRKQNLREPVDKRDHSVVRASN